MNKQGTYSDDARVRRRRPGSFLSEAEGEDPVMAAKHSLGALFLVRSVSLWAPGSVTKRVEGQHSISVR